MMLWILNAYVLNLNVKLFDILTFFVCSFHCVCNVIFASLLTLKYIVLLIAFVWLLFYRRRCCTVSICFFIPWLVMTCYDFPLLNKITIGGSSAIGGSSLLENHVGCVLFSLSLSLSRSLC